MRPYWYTLPEERIAQRPVHPYDTAKLLVSQKDGTVADKQFLDLPSFLQPEDLLILNNTKVIPARLFGERSDTKGKVEVFLDRELENGVWKVMARPLKKLKEGLVFTFGEKLSAEVITREDDHATIRFFSESDERIPDLIEQVGTVPIPPYIRDGISDQQDLVDYQTHFAEVDGSVAAPTASLHFTPDLLTAIRSIGVTVSYITLHVGTPSFQPVFDEGQEFVRPPGTETLYFKKDIIQLIQEVRSRGGRIVAVGTTTVRALETMWQYQDTLQDGERIETELFIQPGYEFKAIDTLITNFHHPGLTHLLLVEAFVGKERVESIYQHALRGEYRFLSYGDGMLLFG